MTQEQEIRAEALKAAVVHFQMDATRGYVITPDDTIMLAQMFEHWITGRHWQFSRQGALNSTAK